MLQDVATAVAIVIAVLICNYECHNSAFYPTDSDLGLEDAHLQAYVFWFRSLSKL